MAAKLRKTDKNAKKVVSDIFGTIFNIINIFKSKFK